MKHTALIFTGALGFSAVVAHAATPVNWPQFRGGNASGVADGSILPTTWSTTDNVAWSTEVPGRGWSSPIVWRDVVYVTSAVNTGIFKAPSTGIFGNDYAAELKAAGHSDEEILKRITARDIELTKEAEEVSYRVFAIDAKTGKVKWQNEAHKGLPPGGRHRKNTYASETPATDGERIYASFGGNVGLFCYSLDGKLLWKKTWPPQPIYLDFGTASSPVVHGGRVYQMHDNEGESFLVALDAKTGDEIWKTSRSGFKARSQSGWATPFIWENGSRTEVITIGKGLVISYGTDGKEIWRLGGMTQATPSPVAGDGLLFVGSGSQGETNRPLFAVKPGATGDLTTAKDAPLNEHVGWFLPRFSAYTSSPLLYRGRVYAVNDNGILQVADAKTGKEIYKSRVGTGSATFSSSPLASAGKIYLLSEDGDMYVVEAGDEYKEVAKNSLGEMSLATPAADAESLFVRTATKLYRMKGPTPKS
ncbi:MAG: PQQ-binding-like beta-propeller repeat protein [Vicinamibacteria bacterium]|nr:PQQ-binding-like beta-propeller repeat protein [Vicinamibacteria bacterium]